MFSKLKLIKKERTNDTFFMARLRLTGWYLLILTVLISGFTYLTFQAKESAYVRVYTVVSSYSQDQKKLVELQDNYAQFNRRFKERVLGFDIFLIITAGITAWWLAGRTLKPIKLMMDEQATFAGDVSHGLRTPLASMLLQIEAFRRKQSRTNPPVKQLLNDFVMEITHMTRIVEGVLALTRSKVGKLYEGDNQVSLKKLLIQIRTDMEPIAKSKGQHLTVQIPKQKSNLKGNYDQWLQVLIILLDNAIKYTPEKGEIQVESKEYGGFVHLTVKDDGPGINQKEQKKVFETYYRGKQKTKVSGAGLGLAIAARIVAGSGGTIKLVDNKPKGAKFVVKAPISH